MFTVSCLRVRERDRQTDRQRDRQIDRETDRQTDRDRETETDRQIIHKLNGDNTRPHLFVADLTSRTALTIPVSQDATDHRAHGQ